MRTPLPTHPFETRCPRLNVSTMNTTTNLGMQRKVQDGLIWRGQTLPLNNNVCKICKEGKGNWSSVRGTYNSVPITFKSMVEITGLSVSVSGRQIR